MKFLLRLWHWRIGHAWKFYCHYNDGVKVWTVYACKCGKQKACP